MGLQLIWIGELGQSRAPSDICKNHPPRIRHSQWCWHRAFTNHGNQRPDLNHDRNNCYQASFLRGTKRFWVTRCNKGFRYRNLRPRGKGRKLSKTSLAENFAWKTMMLRMRMLPNLLPVAPCQWCPRAIEPQPVNQPAGGEGAWGNNM